MKPCEIHLIHGGTTIDLFIPPTLTGRGHYINAPADAEGMAKILRILKVRADVSIKESDKTISTPASPTQFQLDKMVESYEGKKQKATDDFLRSLGFEPKSFLDELE